MGNRTMRKLAECRRMSVGVDRYLYLTVWRGSTPAGGVNLQRDHASLVRDLQCWHPSAMMAMDIVMIRYQV